MSLVANVFGAAHNNGDRKVDTAIEWQALTVRTVTGVQGTVRVAWIVQQLRGVVTVVDVISAVRGLTLKEATQFFSEQNEHWRRNQSLRLERIALTEITGNAGSSDSTRPRQDLEVCPLDDLRKVMDAIACVHAEPSGLDDACARLERCVQDWARVCLEKRLRELSDDQANIRKALQTVFSMHERPAVNHTMSVTTSAANTLPAFAAPTSNSPAAPSPAAPTAPTSNLTSSRSPSRSPYVGPAGAVAPPAGTFWLYDPSPAPPAPASRAPPSASASSAAKPGASSGAGSVGSPNAAPQSNNGSPLAAPLSPSMSAPGHGGPYSPKMGGQGAVSAPATVLGGGGSGGSAGGGASGSTGAAPTGGSRKRQREASAVIPANALSFNQVTGGPELFRCALCSAEVVSREDGGALVPDVAVAQCGHLYCTGCLAGAIVSYLPDDMFKCKRCGIAPRAYDRVRQGAATQRVEVFKGQPPEYWLLPEQHRRFLLPDPKTGEPPRRGVVLTVSSRGPANSSKIARTTSLPSLPALPSLPSLPSLSTLSSPSPSSSPASTRGPTPVPSLPPLSAITSAAGAPYAKAWPRSNSPNSSSAPSSASAGTGASAAAGGTAGAGASGPLQLLQTLPRHESCSLFAGQIPDETANRILRRLCGYFWFSVY